MIADWLHYGERYALRPAQSSAIQLALDCGGLVGHIGVGIGKTLLLALLGSLLPSERPLLFVPASLREVTQRLHAEYAEHWAFRPIPIATYNDLSSQTRKPLEEHNPDLLLLDEAHKLRRRESARTRRVLRYLRKHPSTKVVALSGTLLGASIKDVRHLFRAALGEQSPLLSLSSWQLQQLDSLLQRAPSPAALSRWGRKLGADPEQWRQRFEAWLVSHPGVIIEHALDCDASLVLRPVLLPCVPPEVEEFSTTWELPGRLVCDAFQAHNVLRQLALGIYYRWEYPPSRQWLHARREWSAAVREVLPRSQEDADSPGLIEKAALRGEFATDRLRLAWRLWSPHRQTPEPPRKPVVVSPERREALSAFPWALGPGLIWYPFRTPLEGLPVAPLGSPPDYCDSPIVVSPRSHGTGHNFQAWSTSVVLDPSPSGEAWEQLLGRTHRAGQKADQVTCYVLVDTPLAQSSFARAIASHVSTRLDAATVTEAISWQKE